MIDKIQVAYIEDDLSTAKFIIMFLEGQDFCVTHFSNATDALSKLSLTTFDILILDLNLPDLSGFEICTKIKNKINIPIIVTSAHSEIEFKLRAFKLGVDDYLIKPFDLRELEARIWNSLRKEPIMKKLEEVPIFEKKEKEHTIFFNKKALKLTNIEYRILSILIENKNSLISRTKLGKELSNKSKKRSLDYHIKNIRIKLEDNPSNPVYLKTEYGEGYRLCF